MNSFKDFPRKLKIIPPMAAAVAVAAAETETDQRQKVS